MWGDPEEALGGIPLGFGIVVEDKLSWLNNVEFSVSSVDVQCLYCHMTDHLSSYTVACLLKVLQELEGTILDMYTYMKKAKKVYLHDNPKP